MEVRKQKKWEAFTGLNEIKRPETAEPAPLRQEDGFTMIKGGKGYTIADIEALPEGERAELIDGEMFMMSPPMTAHQRILIKLAVNISLYITNNKGKCEVLPAPFGVYIKKGNRHYVEPDISVICDKEKIDEKGCHGAPDWTIEIVSPSSAKMDYERKVKLYRESGVREYWIVDAERETVTVYDFAHDENMQAEAAGVSRLVRYSFSDRIKAGIFEELYLSLSEMDI